MGVGCAAFSRPLSKMIFTLGLIDKRPSAHRHNRYISHYHLCIVFMKYTATDVIIHVSHCGLSRAFLQPGISFSFCAQRGGRQYYKKFSFEICNDNELILVGKAKLNFHQRRNLAEYFFVLFFYLLLFLL